MVPAAPKTYTFIKTENLRKGKITVAFFSFCDYNKV